MSYIELKNVVKEYASSGAVTLRAVDGMSFEIEKGEFVVIVGPSGAGKTTVLNMLGGMDTITSGEIWVDGADISKYNAKQLTKYRRFDVGFVFQFYNLVPNFTALENVELANQISKNPLNAKDIMEEVGLSERLDNFPAQLSGGEQQRVSIARAIVNNPKLLLCDEPTGNLDPEKSMEIMKVLNDINKNRGTTIIMATHDEKIVNKMKKQVITLKDGHLVNFKQKGKYENEAI